MSVSGAERAILNILEDFTDERRHASETQSAILNILDDFDVEKGKVDTANIALKATSDDLVRSNAELEMFAYAASHDLSEPLRAISGPATLLAARYTGHLDPEADQLIEFMVDGCRRMHALITDMLAYSRVGRLEGTRRAVDCALLLDRVVATLGPSIAETGATVVVGPLPTVCGEPGQLAEVFQNLLSNALKFAAPGTPPEVAVTAARTGLGWEFSVSDNGIGIEPRHRERIFGMFKRLHPRDEYPGTGIGLALVKKIVDHHGGRVDVDDAASGHGTCFRFTLPDDSEASA
jgi:light-regulated signal transduction histidine kinase (bacteriophytochrome)